MSGIVGSYVNHRGSGIVSKLGTDGYPLITSAGAGVKAAVEQMATAGIADDAITLAKMASGTDGNIISFDASGNPVAIATGSDGQVLTSTGAGSPPAFEAAAGGGITQASEWRLTTAFNSAGANPIASNWEEDDVLFSRIGSVMSESSGIFTFPATGVWYISCQTTGYDDTDSSSNWMGIEGTDDDFSTQVVLTINYSFVEGENSNDPSGNAHFSTGCNTIFDVDDTSNCKVKFRLSTYGSAEVEWIGSTNEQNTGCMFIRLGDT